MTHARAQRKENGLNDTFARQTELRTNIAGMQRFLGYLANDDLPADLKAELKERVQEMVASDAETLYHLVNPEGGNR